MVIARCLSLHTQHGKNRLEFLHFEKEKKQNASGACVFCASDIFRMRYKWDGTYVIESWHDLFTMLNMTFGSFGSFVCSFTGYSCHCCCYSQSEKVKHPRVMQLNAEKKSERHAVVSSKEKNKHRFQNNKHESRQFFLFLFYPA